MQQATIKLAATDNDRTFFMAGGGAGLRLTPLDLSNLYLFPLQTDETKHKQKHLSHATFAEKRKKSKGKKFSHENEDIQ